MGDEGGKGDELAERRAAAQAIVEDHLRTWIWRGMTGCNFATALAAVVEKKSRLAYLTLEQQNADVLASAESLIDLNAKSGSPTLLVFPHTRTPNGVRILVDRLCKRPRWSSSSTTGARSEEHLRLTYTTTAELRFSVMGLAPFGTMPVMRRAPYVTLVVWGGGRENPHRPGKPTGDELGLIDIPTGMEKAVHKVAMKTTDDRVRELATLPASTPLEALREIAFVLPGPR